MKKIFLLVVCGILAIAILLTGIIIAINRYYNNMPAEEKFYQVKKKNFYDLEGTDHEEYVTILKSKCRELVEAEGISVKEDLLKVIFTYEMGYFVVTDDGEFKAYEFDIGNDKIYVLAQHIYQLRPLKLSAILPDEIEEEWEFYLDGNTIKLK